jgi:uncharacterized membrane protein YgaE (UPF0421/DUF939 family)
VDLIASPRGLRTEQLRMLAKIAIAAIGSWWVAGLFGADRPAFAAIVPLVALRTDDPYGALGVSVWRVVGTVLGILLGIAALALDPSAPLWLVAGTVVIGLGLGLLARGPAEPINPVTAVVALIVIFVGKGRVDTYAWDRIWETFIGAAVTMVVAVVVWPPDPIVGLRRLLTDLGETVSADLRGVAASPGRPTDEVTEHLDERIRRSMETDGSISVLDRASKGLRWNPRHRGKRVELVRLAVPIRQLLAMSRYSRSLLWSMVGDPDGDRVRSWEPDARRAFDDMLRKSDDAARQVADGTDPAASLGDAHTALERFAASAERGDGAQLARDLYGGTRAMLRVLSPTTTDRLRALVVERYGDGAGR